MNYRYGRRPPRRRITGRFYAFLTVLMVLIVMVSVMISSRNRTPNPPPTMVYDPAAVQNAQLTAQNTQQVQQQDVVSIPSNPLDGANVGADPAQVQQTEEQRTIQPELTENTGVDPLAQQEAQVGQDIEVATPPQNDADLLARAGANTSLPPEWINILLLGTDSRNMNKLERCDTIMVLSINAETGQLKMMSILRDTMIEVPGRGMMKINAVTLNGGVEMMINVINSNLGLNITNYALVNMGGMANIIDILGGVYVNIDQKEAQEINSHMGEVAAFTMEQQDYLNKREDMKIKTWGKNYKLNGIQAVTYSRIRVIDSDHNRVRRQRTIINAMMDQVKDANTIQLTQVGMEIIKHLKTNVQLFNAAGYAKAVLDCKLGKDRIKDWTIPGTETAVSETRNGDYAHYDVNYPELKNRVYRFIYES